MNEGIDSPTAGVTNETALVFDVGGSAVCGILHTHAARARDGIGVVVVVGGPQYRVGAHRQFVHLARVLAAEGYPVLRFDYRGLGDADGEPRDFLSIDDDIESACRALVAARPDVEHVVGWGLCDAASALARHVRSPRDLAALVLVNPWVHTGAAGISRFAYYRARLTSRGLWLGLVRGEVDLVGKLKVFLARRARSPAPPRPAPTVSSTPTALPPGADGRFVTEMREGLLSFEGEVFLVSSGRDITADEFRLRLRSDRRWRRVRRRLAEEARLMDADHTFSTRAAKDEVACRTLAWLARIGARQGTSE